MAHLLVNYDVYKQEARKVSSTSCSSSKRARYSSFSDDSMSIAPPTPMKRISSASSSPRDMGSMGEDDADEIRRYRGQRQQRGTSTPYKKSNESSILNCYCSYTYY